MNRLQLANYVKREAGITGSVLTTTIGQAEEINRVLQWIDSAWLDLQTLHDQWEWMRHPFHFTTTAQQQSYAYTAITDDDTTQAISNFANWKRDSFRKYLVSVGSSGEMILPFEDYNRFRDMYLFGTQRTNYASPAVFTVDPQKKILLGNSPNDAYYINGEYWRGPTTLSADTDTPDMPSQFHMAIVWKALAHYGMYESAPEAVTRAQAEYPKWLMRLEADQLPKITFGAPLA
jgi:hypothetical protein